MPCSGATIPSFVATWFDESRIVVAPRMFWPRPSRPRGGAVIRCRSPRSPWLFGICHKVIANHRRSAKRRARLLIRLTRTRVELGRDPAEILAERSEIGRAFSQLNESQREVLRLVAWEGLSAADAASVLGCSPAAFRVRLHRARSELAKRLGEAGHEGDEAPSAAEARRDPSRHPGLSQRYHFPAKLSTDALHPE